MTECLYTERRYKAQGHVIERQFARVRDRMDPRWSVVWYHHPSDWHLVLLGLLAEAL